ncbi:Alpha/Beta hydrolase protein [Xylaria sp. CBS 124048]|nr:Alpha/Beta hydrolase protein [Xylaria sp. CBS 124048]
MLSLVITNLLHLFVLSAAASASASASASPTFDPYSPLQVDKSVVPRGVSIGFFASLERISRLVDISYCVGTTGIRRPFSCISRCKDFPSLELVSTWNTGPLLGDSCGYVAVDHGSSSPLAEAGKEPIAKQVDDAAIIVAFRGTYSITNTVVDLSTVPQKYVPYPPTHDGEGPPPPGKPEHACTNCTVHMGFLLSWQLARQTVLPELKRLHKQYPNYPIHVIGHSLGGAVGALAALEMKVNLKWDQVIVTTFGEPRVGNLGLVEYLDTAFSLHDDGSDPEHRAYRRVTHVDDPVPLLPLSEWGYRSHAGEFFISKPGLSPSPSDIWPCVGDNDPNCIAGPEGGENGWISTEIPQKQLSSEAEASSGKLWRLPGGLRLWGLFFAHRDYFWRLGLCIPGGDPIDWGRDRYPAMTTVDEL